MSHQKKLEQVLEYIINEEIESASKLLHQVMVEKARDIYEELVEDDEFDEEGAEGDSEFENEEAPEDDSVEDFGGEPKEDFGDDITGEEGFEGEEMGEEELPVEDRIDNLEDMFAELQAEFDELMSAEAGEEAHEGDDMFDEYREEDSGDDFGADEFGAEESEEDFGGDDAEIEAEEDGIHESFDEKEVSVDMGGEGKYSGTGAKTPKAAVNTKSMYSTSPNKVLPTNGAAPIKIKDGGSGKEADKSAKNEKATTAGKNQDRTAKGVESEGHEVGAGGKTASVNKTAPLTKPRV